MFFFPQLIEEQTSRFNGVIKVYKLFGNVSLSVDNLTQSGGLVKNIWHQALKIAANSYKLKAKSCLILGLGGGTAAKLISQSWPEAKILGVEIDPAILQLGKKYFAVDQIKHLKIITDDAFTISYKLKAKSYQLILIDLYHGKSFPHQATTLKFAQNLKRLLHPQGILIINRLNYAHNEESINHHLSVLKQIFPQVTSHKILSNILVFCALSR